MKKIILLIMCCTVFLAACGGDSNTAPNVDLSKCISDFESNMVLAPDYSYVKDYNIEVKNKDISITIVVSDGTSNSDALEFADTVLRQLNLYASQQDGSVALGNSDGYGGLYDYYSASVGVAHSSNTGNSSKWIIQDGITSSKDKLKTK